MEIWDWWPQFVYIGLQLLGIGVILAKHGQPKEGEYNVLTTLACSIPAWVLLYLGGFFG